MFSSVLWMYGLFFKAFRWRSNLLQLELHTDLWYLYINLYPYLRGDWYYKTEWISYVLCTAAFIVKTCDKNIVILIPLDILVHVHLWNIKELCGMDLEFVFSKIRFPCFNFHVIVKFGRKSQLFLAGISHWVVIVRFCVIVMIK